MIPWRLGGAAKDPGENESTTRLYWWRWYSSADGTLALIGHQSDLVGSDGIGEYTATTLSWQGGDTRYQTVFRQYASACVLSTLQ